MGKLLDKALLTYAEDVITEAKKQLAKNRIRTGRKAKWSNGRPVSVITTRHQSKIDDTGSLSRSMKARVMGNSNVNLSMLSYGQQLNEGRRRGRGVPQHELRSWIRRKVRSDIDEKSLTFLINRKIKFFGIDPTHFLDDSFEVINSRENKYITDAIFQELIENIKIN